MVSIHTFEIKAYLTGAEHKRIKTKLGVPDQRQSWTEHRYSDKGIHIILYKGKQKKFIYVKYIINLKRLFDNSDYLTLLDPTDENLRQAWKTIKGTWDEIGCGVPFGRFYLSRVDFTCDVYLKTEELVHEYIRLFDKSILLPYSKKFDLEGIFHVKEMPSEIKSSLQKNCCKFRITTCENIQFYNKIYELKQENLPIPESTIYNEINVLRIELQIHETNRITELLQLFKMHNDPVDQQFAFLIKNAGTFLLDRLERLYTHGRYYKRFQVMDFIQNDFSIKKKTKERVVRFIEDCNKNANLGRCLELDMQNGYLLKRKKALKYLSKHGINPVVINSYIKEYDELPDIFELINNSPKMT